jgi:hypothetical protein
VISTILQVSALRLIWFYQRRQELHVILKLFRAKRGATEGRALHVLRKCTMNKRLPVAAQPLLQESSESLTAAQMNRAPRTALARSKGPPTQSAQLLTLTYFRKLELNLKLELF